MIPKKIIPASGAEVERVYAQLEHIRAKEGMALAPINPSVEAEERLERVLGVVTSYLE